MSRRLTVGVVGGGVGANHITAYAELPALYAVEAVCDVDEVRARELAREHRIGRAVPRYEDLLELDPMAPPVAVEVAPGA